MPKVKLPRSTPSIDMTPMVDLAFLLVTFFMLTTKFRPDEPVTVTIPASVSQSKVSENTTTINIDSAGRVFYDMDGKDLRAVVLQDLAKNFTQIGTLTPLGNTKVFGDGRFWCAYGPVKAIYRRR